MSEKVKALGASEGTLKAVLDENGHEMGDPTPMAPPLGFKKQPSMVDNIRNMVRSELLAMEVRAAGFETAEEADDFDIEDDPIDPSTPYEEYFDPAPPKEGQEVSAVKPSASEVPAKPLDAPKAADNPPTAAPAAVAKP